MDLDELFMSARSGDRIAREALASALYDRLWPRFRRSFSLDEAEDLVQTTMVLLFRMIDGDREPPRSFERLMHATASRVILTARRSWARERERRSAEPLNPDSAVAIETSLSQRFDRAARLEWLTMMVDEMDTVERRTLSGWASESSWQSRAAVEGVARATMRTRVHRILGKLRKLARRREARPAGPEPTPT